MHSEEVLATAIKHHQAGDLTEAERLYRTIVAEDPSHAGALRHLGILAGQIGKPLVAVQLFSLAISAAPREPTFYNDLGNALKAIGKLEEAEKSYRAAIAFDPSYADAHFNLGNVYRSKGYFSAAVTSYERTIALSPLEADAHNNLGTAWLDLGKPEQAERCFLRAIELNPWYAEAHFNRGNALASKGDHVEAIECFDLALKMRANQPKAYVNRGIALVATGDARAGSRSFEQAIALTPEDAVAHNNLGMALLETGDRAQAVLAFQRAIELDAAYAEAHFNLGNAVGSGEGGDIARGIACFNQSLAIRPNYTKALQNRGTSEEAMGELDAAVHSYREALASDPENREILSNLGQVLAFQGDPQGVTYLEELVEDEPDAAKAHWNLGLALLLQGDYTRGFEEYEWRWKCKDWSPRPFAQPQWQGEPLAGKTILLHAEQGQGDTLQLIRYAPLVAQRGGRVAIEVQGSLERLLRKYPGVDICVRQGALLPDFCCHCPLMSLPMVFKTTFDTVPAPVGYRECAATAEGRRTRVGLVWSGNPEHPRNRLRAAPLSEFSVLARVPGVQLISLQKGTAAEQAARGTVPFLPTPFAEDDRIASAVDFADTAAIIASLDLVITVDTAVAHLAGTMGKPVWILISNFPDWRWGLHAETTPWYPTARLFRQRAPRVWGDVLAKVEFELRNFVPERTRSFQVRDQYAEGGEAEILERMGAIAQGG